MRAVFMPRSTVLSAMASQKPSSAPITAVPASAKMREDLLFHRRVVLQRTMPVEMIGRDVQQDGCVRIEARGQVDLITRQFQHVVPPILEGREVENGGADIAAANRIEARRLQQMVGQRGCRGFSVRARDGDDGRNRPGPPPLAHENLGIPDDLDPMRMGELRGPVRLWMGERHAGGEDKRIHRAPIDGFQIDKRQPRSFRRLATLLAVVPGQNRSPAREQRAPRRQPRHSHSENGDGLARKGVRFDHVTSASAWSIQSGQESRQ